MAQDSLLKTRKAKDNSRKTGWAADRKAKRREEAEARNAAYQALSLEEKIARNSTKVQAKLKREQETKNKGDKNGRK